MFFRLGNGLLNRGVLPCFIFRVKKKENQGHILYGRHGFSRKFPHMDKVGIIHHE